MRSAECGISELLSVIKLYRFFTKTTRFFWSSFAGQDSATALLPHDFHRNDRTSGMESRTDLTNVQRIVVTVGLRVLIDMIRVFPSLRQGSVVPQIAVIRKDVVHETRFT